MDAELVLRFVGAFAVIAVVLYGFTALVKGGGLSSGSFLRRERLLEVIETAPLPHQSSLHVVKVAQAYFVIGRSEGAIALLGEVPAEAVERAALRPDPKPTALSRFFPRAPVSGK